MALLCAFAHQVLPSTTRRPVSRKLLTRCSADPAAPPNPSIPRRAVLKLSLALLTALPPLHARPAHSSANAASSAYDIVATKGGQPKPLSFLAGKVTLFVNVASYCALTPQYAGLVALHDELQPAGFEIVASPCDQFARQEPGTDEEVCDFVRARFGARFLLLDKLQVNDAPGGVAPLYRYLKANSPDFTGRVSWNFEKFLTGADGTVLRRYKPGVLPSEIRDDIRFALGNPGASLPAKKKPALGVE